MTRIQGERTDVGRNLMVFFYNNVDIYTMSKKNDRKRQTWQAGFFILYSKWLVGVVSDVRSRGVDA